MGLIDGVFALGRPARIVVRFAIGKPPAKMMPKLKPRLRALLAEELQHHGDLALLNMTDGSCNDGKSWYTFEWALRNYPAADIIFKHDDDTIVHWQLALPRMLRRVVKGRPPVRPLHRLYIGTLAANYSCPGVLDGRHPCAAGSLYGFSGDIVRWIIDNTKPAIELEDMEACAWARRFEREVLIPSGQGQLNPRGLLEALTGEIGGAWVHPVKDRKLYLQCIEDREEGCYVLMFPNSNFPSLQHFRLPKRQAISS